MAVFRVAWRWVAVVLGRAPRPHPETATSERSRLSVAGLRCSDIETLVYETARATATLAAPSNRPDIVCEAHR